MFLAETVDEWENRVTNQRPREVQLVRSYASHYKRLDEFDVHTLPPHKVYISIDLDVIEDFKTGWNSEGRLTLDDVVRLLKEVGSQREIGGADICGFDAKRSGWKKQKYLRMMYTVFDVLRQVMT